MTTIAQARKSAAAEPVLIATIQLLNDGPLLRLGTRQVVYGGYLYEPYIEEIPGITDEVQRYDSSFRNTAVTIKLRNDAWRRFEHLIQIDEEAPFTGAEITISEIYLVGGVATTDADTLLRGNLDEPRDIDDLSFSCGVSHKLLVADKQWSQRVIDQISWPRAYDDWGKYEPIIYGEVQLPCPKVDWGFRTALDADITNVATTGIVIVDPSGLDPAGTIVIDDEEISYTSIAADGELAGVTRHVNGTTAAAHTGGATVQQVPAQADSIVAAHEVTVGSIYAEVDGALRQVLSGVTQLTDGLLRTLLRADPSVSIRGDLTTYTESAVPISLSFSHTDYGTKAAVFGSAPADMVEVFAREHYFQLYVTRMPDSGSVTFSIEGTTVVTVTHSSITYHVGNNPWSIPESVWFTGSFDVVVSNPNGAFFTFYVQSKQRYSKVATQAVRLPRITRFHAAAALVDSGTVYGGGTIERPNDVINHFLIEQIGVYGSDEIDADSFAAAGVSYVQAILSGYKFGFAITDKIVPSELLQKMAFQSRSILRYVGGKWYLDYIPEAPSGVLRTIMQDELAGEAAKFTFRKSELVYIQNVLTASFNKDYAGATAWLGTVKAEDGTSMAKYGIYPGEFQFDLIAHEPTARDVLEHILVERKRPLKLVTFSVFWEHFDLLLGDTIGIDPDALFSDREYFIESKRRVDEAVCEITAREWWP